MRLANLYTESRMLYLLGALVAVVMGWVASQGSLPVALIMGGVIIGGVLAVNKVVLFWAVLAGGLIVSGLAMLYVPQLQLVRWAVAAASLLLVLLAVFERISHRRRNKLETQSPIALQMAALIVVVTLAGVLHGQGPMQLLVGLKSYFQVAGLFFALVLMPWPRAVIDALPRMVLIVAYLQLPFVLHQILFLVPLRVGYGDGIVPFDVVAGTFGGQKFGGGANAVLSAYLLMVVAVLLALWNNRAISFLRFIGLSLPLMLPVFFNESKVSVLYLLIIVLVIFKNEIVERPGRAIISAGFLSALLLGLLSAYSVFYADKADGIGDLVRGTIEQNFSDTEGHGGYYLNRWSSLTYWGDEHSVTRPAELLLGHGPRASREGGSGLDAGTTLADRSYPDMGIGLTAISSLLWETGIIGATLVLAMFLSAFRTAGQLRERYSGVDPYHSGIFSGLQAGVVILTLSLFHKAFFVFDIGFQTIVVLLFGYLTYYLTLDERTERLQARPSSGGAG